MAEMTVNEFVNSFIEAGFDFTYRATKGEVIIDGNVSKKGEHTKSFIGSAKGLCRITGSTHT